MSEDSRKRGQTLKQFILFSGIGIIGTAGHYLTLVLLVEMARLDPAVATTVGFIVGACINYILNYHITFRSNKRHAEALSKFLLIALVGAILNYSIMYIGINFSSVHYLIIQVIATGCVLLWNFALNKLWTFNTKD